MLPAPIYEERGVLRVGARERAVLANALVLAEFSVEKLLLAAVGLERARKLDLVVACQLLEREVPDLQVFRPTGRAPRELDAAA